MITGVKDGLLYIIDVEAKASMVFRILMAPGCDVARALLGGGGILNTVDPIGRGELSYFEFIHRYYSSTYKYNAFK